MTEAAVKAVIFDLDGLLIDSEVISYRLYQDLLKPYGFSLSLEEYASDYSGRSAVKNMELTIEKYGLPFSAQEGLEKIFAMEKQYVEQGVKLKPGAENLLDYLKKKKVKIFLATSSTKERAVTILKADGIYACFDGMVFGQEVERGKPYPDIFLKACEKAKETPGRCLVLEDSEAGIQAASAAKIPVICIPDMKRPDREILKKTAAVFDSLAQVQEFLENRDLE